LSSVGKVVLELDPRSKRVVSSRGELKTLWIDETGEDERLLSLVKAEQAEISKAFDVVVGTAQETLSRNPGGESAMGDWMADCARDFAGSDAALINGGGIRADIPAGPVTLRTLYNVMPFDNVPVKLTLTGRQLAEALDHGAAMSKEMVQTSGVTFKYARNAQPGKRVSHIAVGGKPLDPGRSYTLETVDFLVRGGDGYASLAQAQKQERSQALLRDVLRGCVEKTGLVKAPPGGRMLSMEDSLGTQERAR
jgi:2',3'-cyclic-nucleotide 2'-phosphodiesterase (5'-nucleotidase family)